MASSDPLLPGRYPIWWRQCFNWLASRKESEIDIGQGSEYRPRVLHNKLRGMRQSVLKYGGWEPEVKKMVERGELHFEWRGDELWAVRKPSARSIQEILDDVEQVKERGR